MEQFSIRTDNQNYPRFFTQSNQQAILRCKYCDSKTAETKTPSGITLYYCCNKYCNFYGKIVSQIT